MKKIIMSRWAKLTLLILLTFGLLAGSFVQAQAAVFDDDGIIEANQVIDDDVFLSANKVTVDGEVNGNLLAAGETIIINGIVNGDVVATGGNIIVTEKAQINGNLIAGGQIISVNGKITGSIFGGSTAFTLKNGAELGRNLYYGGYHFESEPGTKVERDIMTGTYQSILGGEVARNISIASAAIVLNGTVGKDATLEVSSPAANSSTTWAEFLPKNVPSPLQPGLIISKDAQINGKLVYTSPQQQSSNIQVEPAGGIVYQTPVPDETQSQKIQQQNSTPRYVISFGNAILDAVRNLFTLLLLGGLILWKLPSVLKKTSQIAQIKPVQSAGYGLAVIVLGFLASFVALLVVLIVGILLSMITLGGLSSTVLGMGLSALSMIMSVFFLVINYGSKLVIAYLIGQLIVGKIFPQASHQDIWSLVIGVVLFVIVEPIPLFGFLISVLVTVIGVGAIWLFFTNRSIRALVEPVSPLE